MKRIIAVSVPVITSLFLFLFPLQIIASRPYLRFEYSLPHFPSDPYGFTYEERVQYGDLTLDYLFGSGDAAYLDSLLFPDGSPVYNEAEVRHLVDVFFFFKVAFVLLYFLFFILLLLLGFMFFRMTTRKLLVSSFRRGALMTLFVIGGLILVALLNWGFFFETFHALLFEAGTWRFYYSDTLIRLFPEQFWFDSALYMGMLTIGSALLILLATTVWLRRHQSAAGSGQAVTNDEQ